MSTNSRTFGKYLNKAIDAVHSAIDAANSVHDPYYKEKSLVLFANAWELLAKALLVKHGGEVMIYETGTRKERTITAEKAVHKLNTLGYITDIQAAAVQQVISLRNEASHSVLPQLADEIVFHLEYYALRYFRDVLEANFKAALPKIRKQYLSVGFDGVKTYSDRVKNLVSKARKNKSPDDLKAAYLLERGVQFSGSEYIKQSDFNKTLLSKSTTRPMFKLKMGEYSRRGEMIVVVPIQAPTGTSADIKLTKSNTGALTVKFDKRATDEDYPHLASDLSAKLGKTRYFVQRMVKDLNIKQNPLYHQQVRVSSKSSVHKYSDACLNFMRNHLAANPSYTPPN